MLSQVNASQNSRQMIDNIHNNFQPFACIMTEKYDNIPRYQSNYYLREESKKEYREKTAQKKQINYLPVFKETIKVEDKKKN